jgi:hypothetical protein
MKNEKSAVQIEHEQRMKDKFAICKDCKCTFQRPQLTAYFVNDGRKNFRGSFIRGWAEKECLCGTIHPAIIYDKFDPNAGDSNDTKNCG